MQVCVMVSVNLADQLWQKVCDLKLSLMKTSPEHYICSYRFDDPDLFSKVTAMPEKVRGMLYL